MPIISLLTCTNVTNVTPSFISTQNLLSISISIFKIKFPRIWIATQLSIRVQALLEVTLEKNLTNVRNVARPLPIVQALGNIIGFILESNSTNAKTAAKPSTISHS